VSPYIVTTKQPLDRWPLPGEGKMECLQRAAFGHIAGVRSWLAEAVEFYASGDGFNRGAVGEGTLSEMKGNVAALPEFGGTISLPDETVIEVERQPDDFDVAAFNAREAAR
jgi:hypothetical protein